MYFEWAKPSRAEPGQAERDRLQGQVWCGQPEQAWVDPGPDAGLELGLDHGFTQFSGDKNAVVGISKQAHYFSRGLFELFTIFLFLLGCGVWKWLRMHEVILELFPLFFPSGVRAFRS